MNAARWEPLTVREAPRLSRKRFAWWLNGRREALALKLAPWLTPRPPMTQNFFFPPWSETSFTYTQSPPPEMRP